MAKRACKVPKGDGTPCQAPPLKGVDHCRLHAPDESGEVAEARRLGGLRRRRERALSGAYDFEGLDSLPKIRRLLEIAVLDTLALENSVARSRTLAYLAQISLKALEIAEFEERLRAVEDVVGPHLAGGGRK